MLIEKIESLREKPPHVRNMVAFWIATLVTLVILGLWAVTIPGRFTSLEKTATTTEDISSDFGISESLLPFFNKAKESFSVLTQQSATTTPSAPVDTETQDIDFKALLASSTVQKQNKSASSTASSTATTSSSVATSSSSLFVPVPTN